MKKIVLWLALLLTLTACGQTGAQPAASSREESVPPSHWVVDLVQGQLSLEDGAEGKPVLVLTAEGKRTNLPLPLDKAPAVYSAQPFSDVLGYSGFVLTMEEGAVGFALRDYYALTETGVLYVAKSFGYDGPQDHSADLDGGGAAEFITNVMYGGDGVLRAYVYQRREDGIWRGDWDPSTVEELKTAGATAYATSFDPQRGLIVVQYRAEGQEALTQLEIPGLEHILFTPFAQEEAPLPPS